MFVVLILEVVCHRTYHLIDYVRFCVCVREREREREGKEEGEGE